MPPRPDTMRNRWTVYAALSATLAAGVILKSLAQRPNFYSAAVYLSQSSANLMILCNLVFVTACTILLFLQKLFYGPLRPVEIEQLYEKAWFAVTETCLAMTIFRGEIGAWFLVMFFSLLAGKVWGWIGEGRVEVLEQQQHNILTGRNARMFHARLASSLILGILFDSIMLDYVVGQVLHMARPDMMVMFGFEFAVLTITSLSNVTRYGLSLTEIAVIRKQKQKRIAAIRKERIAAAVHAVVESTAEDVEHASQTDGNDLNTRRAQAAEAAAQQPIDEADVEVEGWEGKGRFTFYLDLTTDFCKLVIYLSFFFILLIFYGLPLHIMRDVFLTCRSFFKRIGDFLRYRNATRDMNQRYPDATEAEIGREDVCIICREDMRLYVQPAPGAPVDPVAERMRPKKLPCGHVLHFACLRSWLERQQICPTCRATVVPTTQGARGANGGNQAPAARPQHPEIRGNGRPRVFQLGPLRIGVGAVRGNDMLEHLEQQLGNPNPPPAQDQGNVRQQYGFGIRWDGMRPRRTHGHVRHARGSVEDQLNAAERQIQREVDSLQASMGELQALRNVQAQLARIRMAHQVGGAQTQQPGPGPVLPQPNAHVRPSQPAVTSLVSNQQQQVLPAGSDQLPRGLTLPEGWTMTPLQPLQPLHAPQMPVPMGLPNFSVMGGMPAAPLLSAAQLQAMQMQMHHAQPLQTPQAPQAGQQQSTTASRQLPNEQVQAPRAADEANVDSSARTPQAGAVSHNDRTNLNVTHTRSAAAPSTRTSEGRPVSRSPHSAVPMPRLSPVQWPQAQPSSSSVTSMGVSPLSPSQPASPSLGTTPTSGIATGMTAPQRLAPTMQDRPATSSTNGTRNASNSPHRPQKSIGSSWGFAGVENDNDGDDSDEDDEKTTDDEEESEDDEQHSTKTNGVPTKSTASRGMTGKGRGATAEDLVEDPD